MTAFVEFLARAIWDARYIEVFENGIAICSACGAIVFSERQQYPHATDCKLDSGELWQEYLKQQEEQS